MAGKNIRELGWGQMIDSLIWKAPTTKRVKVAKEGEEEYYDGKGELLSRFTSTTSTGSGGVKKVVVGYDTLTRYPDNVNNLANLLSGLSAFTPEGLTDIYDVNGNMLFEALIYDSVLDLADAMLKSESYPNMYYITHYFYIDKTYKTPRIYGKNLAYWTLVGKPNYTNKKQGYPISTYFQALVATGRDELAVNAHSSMCQQIALYLMNSVPDYQGSSFTWEEISLSTFPSRYETYFNWPHFRMPTTGPAYTKMLYNSSTLSFDLGDGKRKEEAEGKSKLDQIYTKSSAFRMGDTLWQLKSAHKIDISFDNEIRECSYRGVQLWENPNFPSPRGNAVQKIWRVNEDSKQSHKGKKREIENHEIKREVEYWAVSSVMLFEMSNMDTFNGYEKGTYRYFIIKPFSEDFFSVQYGTDPYNSDFVYLLIEEDGKNPILQKMKLSKLEWPHLFGNEGFDESKGWSGNFNLLSMPISDWSSKFSKYLKSTDNITNQFRIKFMLAKDGESSHGYFIEPSDKYLSIEKTKIKGINQTRIKSIGS